MSELFRVGSKDLAVSFLPLAHVFQRTVDHLCFYRGVAIHYVPQVEAVPSALADVRPTVLSSVPRFYEKAYVRTVMELENSTAQRPRTRRRPLEFSSSMTVRT